MEEIELKLDEENELLFQVVIEGAREKPSSIRFVCDDGTVSYMFKGTMGSEPGEVRVLVPPMLNALKEGVYDSKLEVLIDGKYLSPLSVRTKFNKALKVVVSESVVVNNNTVNTTNNVNSSVLNNAPPKKQELKVTARAITLKERYQQKKKNV